MKMEGIKSFYETKNSALFLPGVVFNDVYSASKFAMEGFCESLAVQLLKFNVMWVTLTLLQLDVVIRKRKLVKESLQMIEHFFNPTHLRFFIKQIKYRVSQTP